MGCASPAPRLAPLDDRIEQSMSKLEMGVTVLQKTLELVVIPVLGALYYDNAKSSGATGSARWGRSNRYLFSLVVVVMLAVASEAFVWFAPEAQAAGEHQLAALEAKDYENEIDGLVDPDTVDNWDMLRRELVRKFEHAVYASDAGDHEEAKETLLALSEGRDQFGELLRVQSFVVYNNLGVAFFGTHRNRGFKASVYLLRAKELVGTTEPYRETIETNLNLLDVMVNTLD